MSTNYIVFILFVPSAIYLDVGVLHFVTGSKLFVDWLLEYRKSRQKEIQSSMPSASQKYWSGLVEQQMLRKLRQKEEAVAKRVRKLKLHISDIRQRCLHIDNL